MSLRITQAALYRNLTRDLGAALRATADAQRQLSTGQRFAQVSEDPFSAAAVLRSQSDSRHLEQYRRAITGLQSRVASEEAVVGQLADLMDAAREISITQASDTASTATRAATARNVQELLNQAIQLGNTRVGNEYIFAGTATDAPPFDAAGAYAGNATVRRVAVGPSQEIDGNITGQDLLVDSQIVSSLTALRDALQADDETALAAAASTLSTAIDRVNVLYANVSSRSLGLDGAESVQVANEVNTEERIRAFGAVDIEQATVRLAETQQALQAAMAAASKILDTSLLDYLR